jgi:hypothetical protein
MHFTNIYVYGWEMWLLDGISVITAVIPDGKQYLSVTQYVAQMFVSITMSKKLFVVYTVHHVTHFANVDNTGGAKPCELIN